MRKGEINIQSSPFFDGHVLQELKYARELFEKDGEKSGGLHL